MQFSKITFITNFEKGCKLGGNAVKRVQDLEDNRQIAIYSRKSKFTGKGDSTGNQVEKCMETIRSHHKDIEDKDILIFEDEGYSGKNMDRPEFQSMMELCRKGRIKEIYSYKIDRMGRNVPAFLKIIEELNEYNIKFCSATEHLFDTVSPSGKVMMTILVALAQFERETLAERVHDNMVALARTGRWLGGTAPTGYRSQEVKINQDGEDKVRKLYKLDLIKEEAQKVEIIRDKFLEAGSITKVETYLLLNGIKTKNEKEYTRYAIRGILENPVYMTADEKAWEFFEENGIEVYGGKEAFDGKYGIMAYNKTVQNKNGANRVNDMSEWIIAVGKHKPIMTSHDWIKIHKMLQQNKSKTYRKPRNNIALLSGLLRCGNCGSYMRPKQLRGKTEDGDQKFYYLCELKEKSKRELCDSKNPTGNMLDEFVCNEIKKLSGNQSEFMIQLKNAKNDLRTDKQSGEDEIKQLRKAKEEKEKKIQTLVNRMADDDGDTVFHYIKDQINTLHEECNTIGRKIEEIKRQNELSNIYDSQFDIMQETLSNFGSAFDTMSLEQKRTALRLLIDEVVWDGENVHIYLFGARKDHVESDAATTGLQMNS